MVLNNLVGHILRGARVRQFLGEAPSEAGSTSTVEISLDEAFNINRYTFFVIITSPFPTILPDNPGPEDVLDENAFILKELAKYVSSLKKAKETLSTVIYDKTNSVDIAAALAKLPSDVQAFVFTTKLEFKQEADVFRVFNVSRKLSIALIERKAPNDLQIVNTVTHNILKSDNRPAWPRSFTDTRIICNEHILKSIEGKIVPQTNVHKKSWKIKAVFCSNWMIPLCRNFVQSLWSFYHNMIKNYGEDHFEIFGVMFDIEKYNDHVLFGMPWCTLKSTREQMDRIKYTFGVSHVPSLVFLDENDDIITRNGRALVFADPLARSFDWSSWTWRLDRDLPWKGVRPWNYYLIFEVPLLIIFGDADDDIYISSLIKAVGDMQRTHVQRHLQLTKTADTFSHQKLNRNQFISGSTMLLHKSLDDEEFLVRFGLDDLGVPLAVIYDPFVGVFVCDDEQISEEGIKKTAHGKDTSASDAVRPEVPAAGQSGALTLSTAVQKADEAANSSRMASSTTTDSNTVSWQGKRHEAVIKFNMNCESIVNYTVERIAERPILLSVSPVLFFTLFLDPNVHMVSHDQEIADSYDTVLVMCGEVQDFWTRVENVNPDGRIISLVNSLPKFEILADVNETFPWTKFVDPLPPNESSDPYDPLALFEQESILDFEVPFEEIVAVFGVNREHVQPIEDQFNIRVTYEVIPGANTYHVTLKGRHNDVHNVRALFNL